MHSNIVRTAADSFFSRSARSSGVAFMRRWVDFALGAVRQCQLVRKGDDSKTPRTHRANRGRVHLATHLPRSVRPWTGMLESTGQKESGSRSPHVCVPDLLDANPKRILLPIHPGRTPPALRLWYCTSPAEA